MNLTFWTVKEEILFVFVDHMTKGVFVWRPHAHRLIEIIKSIALSLYVGSAGLHEDGCCVCVVNETLFLFVANIYVARQQSPQSPRGFLRDSLLAMTVAGRGGAMFVHENHRMFDL